MPRYYRPYKAGQKVIIRSNENEPTWIGTFVGWETHPGGDRVPVVADAQGKKWFCLSAVRPYSDELFEKLISLDPKEAWDFLAEQNRGNTPCYNCGKKHIPGSNLPQCFW